MKAELRSATATQITPDLFPNCPPATAALHGCLGTLDASCTEKLLVHCAAALESNDATLAQQVMWVLNNVAAATGDPNQRLTSHFLKALVARASRLCPNSPFMGPTTTTTTTRQPRPMTVTDLAAYIDLTPWHRFGFSASNGAILHAVQHHSKIHVIDFSITHCMQWPTLIDALSKRPEGPPSLLRITVPLSRPPVPPALTVSIESIGRRLSNFAFSRNLPFEFHVTENPSSSSELLNLRDDEAVVVNCQSWLRYLPSGAKDGFLTRIRELDPRIVTVSDEDADLDSPSLTARTVACFNYLWIPFDAMETLMPRESKARMEYEADVGEKIENYVVAEREGEEEGERVERGEGGGRTARRMKAAGFRSVGFDEGTVREVKGLLDEHASGWGMKREEEMMVLTWKGHGAVFTMAWVPDDT